MAFQVFLDPRAVGMTFHEYWVHAEWVSLFSCLVFLNLVPRGVGMAFQMFFDPNGVAMDFKPSGVLLSGAYAVTYQVFLDPR